MGEVPDRADLWLARNSESPQIVVVGLPWSPDSMGVAMAPLALRDRLSRFVTFHSERLVDFADIRARDAGNWPVHGLDLVGLNEYVSSRVDELPKPGLSLFLGGDEAITTAILGALALDSGLIRFSSGPFSGTGSLDGVETVTIGAHGFSGAATKRKAGGDSSTLSNEQIGKEGIRMIVDRALGKLAMRAAIHVSVDLDALDPAFAPGSPDSMPGGLDVRQLSEGVRRCAASPKVSTMDFVGADTDLDTSGRTLDVTCHLLLSAVTGYKERSLTR